MIAYYIVIAIVVFLIILFFYLLSMSFQTKKWPETLGIIIESKLCESSSSGEYNTKSYKAKIRYSYIINNKEYHSTRVFWGSWIEIETPNPAKRIIKKYPSNMKVTVYYNPFNPKQSVLETGVNSVIYRILIAVVIVISLLIYFPVEW